MVRSAPDGPCAVLAASREALRVEEVAPVLARVLGCPPLEARLRIRRSRGILFEGIEAEEARRIARGLAAEGVRTVVVPVAEVGPLPEARLLRRIEPAPTGLRVRLRNGVEETIAWERVAVIATDGWTETVSVEREAPGARPALPDILSRVALGAAGAALGGMTGFMIPAGAAPGSAPERRISRVEKHRAILDLLLHGPADRVRAEAHDFDWSGLGPAMAPTGEANLRALVAMLAAALPDAPRSAGADRCLGSAPDTLGRSESEAEFLREQRWLRALRASRE
jgi:hypothetical protein